MSFSFTDIILVFLSIAVNCRELCDKELMTSSIDFCFCNSYINLDVLCFHLPNAFNRLNIIHHIKLWKMCCQSFGIFHSHTTSVKTLLTMISSKLWSLNAVIFISFLTINSGNSKAPQINSINLFHQPNTFEKKTFSKFRKIHRKTHVPELLF